MRAKTLISSEAQHKLMLDTPIHSLVPKMALPTVICQLVTVLYNTADTYFVAKLGTSAAAAVGVVFSLMSMIQALSFGLGVGAGNTVSRLLGNREDERAHVFGNSAFFFSIIMGAVLMVLGLVFLDPLMRLLGSTDTILPYAGAYARYILLAAPLMCPAFVMNLLLRSEGEAKLAMWGLSIGGVMNIALDPLFIFGFNMGIAGAALATALCQLLSFLILLSFFLRGKSVISLSLKWFSASPSIYLAIFKTGAPTVCRQGLASVATAILNTLTGSYSDAAVAAVTISNKIYLFIRNIVLGIGQGFQPIAGYNYGAGEKKRVREAFVFSTELGTLICTLSAFVFFLNAPAVMAWFVDDAEAVRIGAVSLRMSSAVMPFMAYSTYVNQMYQCLGFSRVASVLACSRQGIFFVPLSMVLPKLLGLAGIQALQPAADFLTFLLSVPLQLRFFRKNL